MNLSIVLSTFNRAHLLRRSLSAYLDTMTPDDELIIIDDESDDNTGEMLEVIQCGNSDDIKYIRVSKPRGVKWRDCAATLNIGIRCARNPFIILTHPEIIPGPDTLRLFREVSETRPDAYICAKGYYLNPQQQAFCAAVNNFALSDIRSLPDFYSATGDYSPTNIDRLKVWESWIFGGLSREQWRHIGGMYESTAWGTVDITFLTRRRLLGIENVTLLSPDSYVIHQNHDVPVGNFVPTDRDMDRCHREAPRMSTYNDAICDHL